MAYRQLYRNRSLIGACLLLLWCGHASASDEARAWLDRIEAQWGIERYQQETLAATGFPIPLGAMEKVRGTWRHKEVEPFTGELVRTTWQVSNTPVTEVYSQWRDALLEDATLVFECSARGCGNASQWANRVYGERLLYGRAEYMRYAAFQLSSGEWLTLFTAARTADRQYLHVDLGVPE